MNDPLFDSGAKLGCTSHKPPPDHRVNPPQAFGGLARESLNRSKVFVMCMCRASENSPSKCPPLQ